MEFHSLGEIDWPTIEEMIRMLRSIVFLVTTLVAVDWVLAEEQTLSSKYGFKEPEVYKLDFRTTNLIARDVDGDGKTDLAVTNNLKHRIDVLAQRGKPEKPAAGTGKVNDISYDQRMEHRKIQVRRNIQSLEIKDVNSDGRADIVYLGDPKGLYIEYQQPDGSFGQERTFENADAQASTWSIEIGDLDGDGKDDIAYLGQKYLYLIYQQAAGKLSDPKRFRLGDDQAGLLKILDINSDKRNDLIYFAQTADLPIRLRYQEQDKTFGPERRLRIDPPRGVSFAPFDDKPGEEVLSISSLNNRLMVYTFDTVQPTDDTPTGQAVVFPFDAAGSGKSPDVAVGDFNGDGRTDIIASDADSSQIQFFNAAQTVTTFPNMLGTESLRAVDANGDNKSALIALSAKDKSLGVSEFVDGRLSFPRPLPIQGDIIIFDVVGSKGDTRILYISKESREKDGKKEDVQVLHSLKPTNPKSDSEWGPDKFGSQDDIVVKFDVKPNDMRTADVNGDGRLDILVFLPFKPPTILLSKEDGTYAAAPDTAKGTLGNLTSADIYYGPILDGKPAFLATQESFARNLRMGDDGRWNVVDQYNSLNGNAKVKGVCAIDLVGDKTPELVLYDRASQSLVFLRAENGLYRAWQTLRVGGFDLRGMRTGDFNGDGTADILLFDGEKMAIVYSRTADTVLKLLASYESDNKDAQLFDMVPGDLNGDGKLDILILDPMDHNLEIVTSTADGKIERALKWQVFEEKTFQRQGGSLEPREAVIADLDADGLNDIALLVHDRVIIYLQDDGSTQPTATTASE